MTRKTALIFSAALVAATFASAFDSAQAFELFPRPVEQYTVKRGDTLYGIAGRYYSNPALWPFLWNQNPSVFMGANVQDPKSEPLVPGTKVDLYHRVFPYIVSRQTFQPPTGIPDDLRFLARTIPYKGVPYEKAYFRHRLSPRPTQLWGYIAAAPDTAKAHYLERDLVYINFRPSKRQCILVGDRFGIYRDRGPIFHPRNPETPIGHLSEIVGEVEIISTGHELITAIILESYVEIVRGDKVSLFAPRSREIVPAKTHRMLVGTILQSATRETFYQDSHNLENDIVFIDRGECDGMKEGFLVNIYRPTFRAKDPLFDRFMPVPDQYVGEGMVLKAFDKNSTVLITRSREEVIPGDIVKTVSD
jgi:hypothetical protein